METEVGAERKKYVCNKRHQEEEGGRGRRRAPVMKMETHQKILDTKTVPLYLPHLYRPFLNTFFFHPPLRLFLSSSFSFRQFHISSQFQ